MQKGQSCDAFVDMIWCLSILKLRVGKVDTYYILCQKRKISSDTKCACAIVQWCVELLV